MLKVSDVSRTYGDLVVLDKVSIDRFATRLWVVEGGRVRAFADRADWVRARQS